MPGARFLTLHTVLYKSCNGAEQGRQACCRTVVLSIELYYQQKTQRNTNRMHNREHTAGLLFVLVSHHFFAPPINKGHTQGSPTR